MVEIVATIMMMHERDRREPREQADNDESAANGFDHAHEWSHHMGIGDADVGEEAGPENIRKGQLLDFFGGKHCKTDEKTNQNGSARRACTENNGSPIRRLHVYAPPSFSNNSPNNSRIFALTATNAFRPFCVAR